MYSLNLVSVKSSGFSFCLTDCGPSDGCNPDDELYDGRDIIKEDK